MQLKEVLKTPIRWALKRQAVESALRGFYMNGRGLTDVEVETVIAEQNTWFLSQAKSGTTLLCNSVAFYNAKMFGIENIDFGNIHYAGVARNLGNSPDVLRGVLNFAQQTGVGLSIVHTHKDLPNCHPSRLITTTRNPLDYAVSSYYFHYKFRSKTQGYSVDEALPRIVKEYIRTLSAQASARKRSEKVLDLSYESLMADPEGQIGRALEFIHGFVDSSIVRRAIDASSPENLRKFESVKGNAVVVAKGANGNFLEPHFIRSGEIGEGERILTNRQKKFVLDEIRKAGLS